MHLPVCARHIWTISFLTMCCVSCAQDPPLSQDTGVSTVHQAALSISSQTEYQLIPAYYNYESDQASMDALVNSAASNGLRGIVVANFGTPGGPGALPPPSANASFVSNLQSNGVPVLGYVDSVYGRAPSDMYAEINNWISYYHVDGIFFDDADRDLGFDGPEIQRMRWFQNYVAANATSSLLPGGPMTVFNWGVDYKLEPYVYCSVQAGVPEETLIFNTFEGPETASDGYDPFSGYTAASWISGYPSTMFGNLVYGANSNGETLAADMNTIRANGAAWGYVTEGYPSQWSKLVGYFENPTTDTYWANERAVSNGGPYSDFPTGGTTDPYAYCAGPALTFTNGDFSQNIVYTPGNPATYPEYGWGSFGTVPPQWESQNSDALVGSTSTAAGVSGMTQLFTVPSPGTEYSNMILTFWYSSNCQGYGWTEAYLYSLSGSGGTLAVPVSQCTNSGWTEATVDVTAWVGMDVGLNFEAWVADAATWMRVMDVELTAE